MSEVETDLAKLLAGEIVDTATIVISHSSGSSAAPNVEDFKPVVKRTVCYIVMALVFDDDGRVVLIQEAKPSCKGLWYIPAGRVEPGENFIDGVKRECLEEAGLEIEAVTVFSIESNGLYWYRIGYIGRVTGGKLKTLDEKDSESLQAKFFKVEEILGGFVELRHNDFFTSLKLAQKYISLPGTSKHPHYQIGIQPHTHLLCRPVILKQIQGSLEVLCLKEDGKTRLPCIKLYKYQYNLSAALTTVFRDVFQKTGSDLHTHLPIKGVLTVEHCGIPARENDGMCITPVFVLPGELHDKFDKVPNKDYLWFKIEDKNVLEKLTHRTFSDNMLIPVVK